MFWGSELRSGLELDTVWDSRWMADHPFISVRLTSREERVDPVCVCVCVEDVLCDPCSALDVRGWSTACSWCQRDRLQFCRASIISGTCHARHARPHLQKRQSESELAETRKDGSWKWKGIWSHVTGRRAACLSYVLSDAPFLYYVSDVVAWWGFNTALQFISTCRFERLYKLFRIRVVICES